MLLYDIGNSSIKRYKNGKITRLPLEHPIKDKNFYYISVNKRIKKLKNGIDISSWFNFKTQYQGLGIDRVAACYAISNGIVVDAGSAITIDIMEKNIHKGGIILPGLKAYQQSFATISPVLNKELNQNISLTTLPTNTQDAISFGIFGSIVSLLEKIAGNNQIYITGGDGKQLNKFIKNSIYKEDIIFLGMIKAIKEKNVNNSPA